MQAGNAADCWPAGRVFGSLAKDIEAASRNVSPGLSKVFSLASNDVIPILGRTTYSETKGKFAEGSSFDVLLDEI